MLTDEYLNELERLWEKPERVASRFLGCYGNNDTAFAQRLAPDVRHPCEINPELTGCRYYKIEPAGGVYE